MAHSILQNTQLSLRPSLGLTNTRHTSFCRSMRNSRRKNSLKSKLLGRFLELKQRSFIHTGRPRKKSSRLLAWRQVALKNSEGTARGASSLQLKNDHFIEKKGLLKITLSNCLLKAELTTNLHYAPQNLQPCERFGWDGDYVHGLSLLTHYLWSGTLLPGWWKK